MDQKKVYQQFTFDLMQSERLRARLLGIVMVIILVGFLLSVLYNREVVANSFPNHIYWYLGIFLMFVMAIRAFVISRFVKVIYHKKRSIPRIMQLGNVFFEISLPSVIIAFFATQNYPYNALVAPITQLYFIMIILTIMEMDMKVSAFAGILSGVEFFLIAVYFVSGQEPPETASLLGQPEFYLGRSLIMIISGFVAGYLAERIKKNAIKFYDQQIEKRKVEQLFGQQLSPEIAERLIQSPSLSKPEKHKACIMFLDIRDFTPLTENMSPEEIIAFQNYIFPDMFQIVTDNKGIVNQVMGDGFMATFGAPVPIENPSMEALNCCQAILEMIEEKSYTDQFPKIRVGIGLHFGPVITGNIGSELRKQFSITGQTVIIASRLEQLNKSLGTQLLFSSEVMEQVKNGHHLHADLGEHKIKGFSNPARIFTLQLSSNGKSEEVFSSN